MFYPLERNEDDQVALDSSISPRSVIVLQYSDEILKDRIKSTIPPEELPTSRYTEDLVNK
jgi:hypothetical protein